jgi:hypothetical protein
MNSAFKTAQSDFVSVGRVVESQSVNSLVAGFSFAAAISWMDVVRAIVSNVVSVQKNGVTNAALTALLTTILSVLVFLLMRRLTPGVKQPAQPLFAVTA